MTTALWVLLIAFPLALFWTSSRAASERATYLGKQLCLKANVHQIHLSIQRNVKGRMQWRRVYRYEYSHGQNDRFSATITMLGQKAIAWIDPISYE